MPDIAEPVTAVKSQLAHSPTEIWDTFGSQALMRPWEKRAFSLATLNLACPNVPALEETGVEGCMMGSDI